MSLLDHVIHAAERGSKQLDEWVERRFGDGDEGAEPKGWEVDSRGEAGPVKPPPPADAGKRGPVRRPMSVSVFQDLPVDSAAALIWKLALKHPQGPEVIRRVCAIREEEVGRHLAALMADLEREGVGR